MLANAYKIFWALTAPFSGAIGWLWLKRFALKIDEPSWRSSFLGKRVLIVGTGPSLDVVDESYYLNFDVIVYINHAVKCARHKGNEYFFSTDVNVVKGIYVKTYFENIEKFGRQKSILAPIFFQQTLFLSKEFRGKFSWLKASRCRYIARWSNGRLKLPITRLLWPVQPDAQDLELWFSQDQQVSYFPVIEKTSALSSILFVSKYEPASVTLIGCDFGVGRSKHIEQDCPGHGFNAFNGAIERFEDIKKFLFSKNIELKNDSWS